MTAPTYPVFEGDGGANLPRLPTVDDLGGLLLVNSTKAPPNPDTELSAEAYKQLEMCLVRMARMSPMLVVEFDLDGGGGIINKSVPCSINDSITASTVTVTMGVDGPIVSWPSGKLPVVNRLPFAVQDQANSVLTAPICCSQTGTTVSMSCYDTTFATTAEAHISLSIFGEH